MNAHREAGAVSTHEWAIVLALAFGTALVGADRYMILPMFPVLMRELSFGYGSIGLITGCLGFAYGISSLAMGALADRIGRRRIVIGAALAFSVLAGCTGLAVGVISLCLLRVLMGVADGAFMTSAIVTNLEASTPSRKGRNLGIQLTMLPLVGLALTPVIVSHLIKVIEWRFIFVLLTPIGLVSTLTLWRVLRPGEERAFCAAAADRPSWRGLFTNRNVVICMFAMVAWVTSQVALSALLPSYLVDHLKLSTTQMGWVLSATGLGGAAGNLTMPVLSDWIGRRAVILIAAAGVAVFIVAFMNASGALIMLFILLFAKNYFTFPLIGLTVGPAIGEAVPASQRASAVGLASMAGEIFGAGLAPILVGYMAEQYGLRAIFILPLVAVGLGFFACCFLTKTAPQTLVSSD